MTPDDVHVRWRSPASGRIAEWIWESDGTEWTVRHRIRPCDDPEALPVVAVPALSISPDDAKPQPDRASIAWSEGAKRRKLVVERTSTNEWALYHEVWSGAEWHTSCVEDATDVRLDIAEVNDDDPLASV